MSERGHEPDYADLLADNLAHQPFDRAVLGLYAELVHAATRSTDGTLPQVKDVGCGPGRITAHLASLKLDASGISGLRLDAYRLRPDQVEADLAATGFTHVAHLTRAPIDAEKNPQAYIIARAEPQKY